MFKRGDLVKKTGRLEGETWEEYGCGIVLGFEKDSNMANSFLKEYFGDWIVIFFSNAKYGFCVCDPNDLEIL